MEGKLSLGEVVGVIVGIIVAIAILIGVAWLFTHHARKKQKQPISTATYSKDQNVIYTYKRSGKQAKATVVDVHFDDPKELYYTIRFNSSSGDEYRQTVGEQLRPA